MSDDIWKKYINGLVKNEGIGAIINQLNDFDKMYLMFRGINTAPNITVKVEDKELIQTYAYYFVKCKYDDENKLDTYEILYSKLPIQN